MGRFVTFACLLAAALPVPAQGPPSLEDFSAGAVTIGDRTYPYRLLEPLTQLHGTPRPLVVFLHGAGERGDDNAAQLRWLPERLAAPDARTELPCYLLAVQCPTDEKWVDVPWHELQNSQQAARPTRALAAVMQAIDDVVARPGIDPARIYATGLSMGGFGAIELVARQPDRFAALLAVCGGGDPLAMQALVGVPAQFWHGGDDAVVPPARTRELVAALRTLGAPVLHQELPGVGHDVWRQAYGDRGALPWLFAQDQRQQRRGAFAVPAVVPAVDGVTLAGGWFVLQRGSRCFAGEGAQAAATLFLDSLEATAVLRPGLAVKGEPASGDIAFVLEPGLATPWRISIDDQLRVVARDAVALGRAAAAAAQAMRTGPLHACPRGRIAPPALPPGGRLTFVDGSAPWSLRAVLAVLREAWWFGVDEVVFGTDACPRGLGDGDWAKVEAEARRCGVQLLAAAAAPARGTDTLVVAGDDVAAVLVRPATVVPVRFDLRLPPLPANDLLLRVRWLLPATAERAARPDPLHVGGYWSRVGHLRR